MFLQSAGRSGDVPAKDFLYQRKGPWPQPSPIVPLGTAPEVLHLPWQERLEFNLRIGLRYFRDFLLYSPVALFKALGYSALPAIADGAFADVLTRGIYSKFLAPLDDADRNAFGVSSQDPSSALLRKLDFTPIADVQPYQGMYVAKTVTLVRRSAPSSPTFTVEAIAIGNTNPIVLRAGGGDAWELAKYYVLQGCGYGTLFTQHPNVHFPFDSINAITKGSLPVHHKLFKLLVPHFQFSLVLNNSVLQSPVSIVSDYRAVLYDPFAAKASNGLMSFFVAGYKGIDHPRNSAYPGYSYPHDKASLPVPDTRYGEFLSAYFDPFLRLTTAVVGAMSDDEMSYAEQWARWIKVWIKTFPDLPYKDVVDPAVRAETRRKLAFAAAVVMWNASVVHSTDHHDYATDIPVDWKCFRLRVPPPSGGAQPALDRRALSRWYDLFKSHLAHRMFFAPTTITRLVDTDYKLGDAALNAAQAAFHRELRDVEANLKKRGVPIFMKLDDMARSIQY